MTKKAEKDQPAYPIGSVDKALRLVVLVAGHPAGVRLGDATAALGVAPSTAHRLLQMLVHHGFARQDPETKAYHPGETMERLANPRERVRQLAHPILTSLVEEFGETVHLSVLDGTSALTVVSVESPHLLRVGNREGHAQPAVRSGMGRVLLSGQDDAVRREMIAAEEVDADRLAAHLREVEEKGYLLQHGEMEPGVSALAVPVRGASGTVEYAIGVTFPTGRVAEQQVPRLVRSLKASAAQLEDELRR